MRTSITPIGTTEPPATRSVLLQSDGSRPTSQPGGQPGGQTRGPGLRPDVVSKRDEFSYQVPRVTRYHGSGIYWWPNGGIAAHVFQASTVNAGSTWLVIRDANGAEVYSRSLAESGSFLTKNGATGRWTVQVVYDGASGTVGFRVLRKI